MDQPQLRVCSRCRASKPVSEFLIKNAAKGLYRSSCRTCCRAYGKEHYRKNLESYVFRAKRRRALDIRGNRKIVRDYLAAHPCVDCGEADPVVLDFDHRDPSTKRETVGKLAHRSTAGVLLAEIEKCDVRCGNCHRIRTANQFGSYRLGEDALAYRV